MKKTFLMIFILSPLLFFPQRKVEDFFNNRIDFVLDNDYGRAFMGAVVKEYIIDDSLSVNNAYNKIGIQPFYKYSQSIFFDKNLLMENAGVYANKEKTEFTFNRYVDLKTYNDFTLNINSVGNFDIKSVMEHNRSGIKTRVSYYEPFKNFGGNSLLLAKLEGTLKSHPSNLLSKTIPLNLLSVDMTIQSLDKAFNKLSQTTALRSNLPKNFAFKNGAFIFNRKQPSPAEHISTLIVTTEKKITNS